MESIDWADEDFDELKNSNDVQLSRYATCMICPNIQRNPNCPDLCGLCGCEIVKIVIFNFKQCPIGSWKN